MDSKKDKPRSPVRVIFPQEYSDIRVGSYCESYDSVSGDRYHDLTFKEALDLFFSNNYRVDRYKRIKELNCGGAKALLGYIREKREALEKALEDNLSKLDDPDRYLLVTSAGFAKTAPTSFSGLHQDVSVLKNIERIIEDNFIPDATTGRREMTNENMMYKY